MGLDGTCGLRTDKPEYRHIPAQKHQDHASSARYAAMDEMPGWFKL